MSVVDAVETFIRANITVAEDPLAATAMALAFEIDKSGNSATSKSMCARALMDVLVKLRELAPGKTEESPLDEIRSRRDKKLARVPGSTA